MPELPLKDKVAIVTGAGRGIGLEIARQLAARGARLLIADLDEEQARTAAAGLGTPFAGDLSDETTVAHMVEMTLAELGTPAILVNNAGGGILRPFLEHTPDTLRATIDRNLWTAIWCSWHVLPHMKQTGWGRIINIGADSVRSGIPAHSGYNAAKGGMHALTGGLAKEFARDGITVNTVAPCAVVTPQYREVERSDPELIRRAVEVIPMGRAASEAEIASMVTYLASEEAAFVTGQIISVNGGTTIL